LKNQHLFDIEGHASVPLLPPKEAHKYHAYREIYADQLGAWDLQIQRAEILKFNGLINYWHTDTPVYPMQAQLARDGMSEAHELMLQLSPKHGAQNLFGSLPHRQQIPTDVYTSIQPLPLRHYDDITGEPLLKPVFHHNIVDYSLPKAELDKSDASAETEAKSKPKHPILGSRNCHICLERIQGLFVSCPRGEHKAHATCYEEYVDGRSEEEMRGKGVSCGCKPRETEDWKSEGLETSWGSIMGGKLSKFGAL
jgi:hypothetical protein